MQPRQLRSEEESNSGPYADREQHLILNAESLRYAEPPNGYAKEPPKPEEKISVLWRVFGGTILSVTALVAITIYQSFAGSMRDLRADYAKLHDQYAEAVKKEDLKQSSTTLWQRLQEITPLSNAVSVMGNRQQSLEAQFAAADKERKEMQASLVLLLAMKDKIASVDELKKTADQDHKELLAAQATLASLREKDACLEKLHRDAEADRKELNKEIQALRERLAKLEGARESKPAGNNKPAESGQ